MRSEEKKGVRRRVCRVTGREGEREEEGKGKRSVNGKGWKGNRSGKGRGEGRGELEKEWRKKKRRAKERGERRKDKREEKKRGIGRREG